TLFLANFSKHLKCLMASRYLVQTAWLSLATEAHYRENNPLHKGKNEKKPSQATVRTLFTQSVQNRYD
ncbi:MAG: hypothetical protein ACPG5V_11785, partial [Vibrio cyclitrophicus]